MDDSLFPCGHEACRRTYLDLERLMLILTSNIASLCTDFSGKVEILFRQLETKCKQIQTQETEKLNEQQSFTRKSPSICAHSETCKTLICYFPKCTARESRICCAECIRVKHANCQSQFYTRNVNEHVEHFPQNRTDTPLIKVMQRFDDKLIAVRERVRTFLNSVERVFNDNIIFSKEFDLQVFAENLGQFNVGFEDETGLSFEYKNKDLVDQFTKKIDELLQQQFVKSVELQESNFYISVTLFYVINDELHVDTSSSFLEKLIVCVAEKLQQAKNTPKNGEEKREQDGPFLPKVLKEFWKIKDVDNNKSEDCQVYQFGMERERCYALEIIRREFECSVQEQREFDVIAIETFMHEESNSGGNKWVCELYPEKYPLAVNELPKWMVVGFNSQSVFLFTQQ